MIAYDCNAAVEPEVRRRTRGKVRAAFGFEANETTGKPEID
jgi:hypothetical protein